MVRRMGQIPAGRDVERVEVGRRGEILYNNAARFLRMSEGEMTQHHTL